MSITLETAKSVPVNFQNPKEAVTQLKILSAQKAIEEVRAAIQEIKGWMQKHVLHQRGYNIVAKDWNRLLKANRLCYRLLKTAYYNREITFHSYKVNVDDILYFYFAQDSVALEKRLEGVFPKAFNLFRNYLFAEFELEAPKNIDDYIKICEIAEIAHRLNISFVEKYCFTLLQGLSSHEEMKSAIQKVLMTKLHVSNLTFMIKVACQYSMDKLLEICLSVANAHYKGVITTSKTADNKVCIEDLWENPADEVIWDFLESLGDSGCWSQAVVNILLARHGDEQRFSGKNKSNIAWNPYANPFLRLLPSI